MGRLGNQMFQLAFLYNHARLNYKDRWFQDPTFFKENEEEIKRIFRNGIPKEPLDYVAIHVRRGDYVGHDHFIDLMNTSYYEEAKRLFPHSRFMVFSDDIEWCKEQSIFQECVFSQGTEIYDMNNMAVCIGHIIANSSFSWWAAYIAPYTKKVVAPSVKNWCTDGIERTVCPPEWIRI